MRNLSAGNAAREVAELQCGAAQVFKFCRSRFVRAVAGAGAAEVGEYVRGAW